MQATSIRPDVLIQPADDRARRAAARLVADGRPRRLNKAMSTALRHRLPLALIDNVAAVGGDLMAMTVGEPVWLGASTHRVLRPVPVTDGRLTLWAIQEELKRHRRAQWEVLAELASFREHFLVCFGLGLSARFDFYATRWSHDIDLLVDSLSAGRSLAGILAGRGFSVTEHRIVDADNGVADWRLDRSEKHGGFLHVDLSCGAVSNSTSRLPPLALPGAFERRREVECGGVRLYVPGDLHQVILLVQKVQRTMMLDARVVNDIGVLIDHGDLTMAELSAEAERHRLLGALAWLIDEPWRTPVAERAILAGAARIRPSQRRTRQAAKRLYGRVWE